MDKFIEYEWLCASIVGQIRAIIQDYKIGLEELADKLGTSAETLKAALDPKERHEVSLERLVSIVYALDHRASVILFPYRDDTVPFAASTIPSLFLGVELSEESAPIYLGGAIAKIAGVEKVIQEGPELVIKLSQDYHEENPVALPHIYSCVEFVNRITGASVVVDIQVKGEAETPIAAPTGSESLLVIEEIILECENSTEQA